MSEPNRRNTLLLWLLPVVLLALAWLVLDALLDRVRQGPQPPAHRPTAADRDPNAPMRSLTELTDPALTHGRPLTGEPADLPEPPGGVNLLRRQQTVGNRIEEDSVWRVERKNTAALASFYQEAAAARGFELTGRREDRARRVVSLSFHRGGDVLDVRLSEPGDAVRVVIRFGYTKLNRNEPATPSEADRS